MERQAILYILYDLHNKNCNNLQEKTVCLLPVRTVFSEGYERVLKAGEISP